MTLSSSIFCGWQFLCLKCCSWGKKNYGLAAVHYRKALLHFDYTFAETEDRCESSCLGQKNCLEIGVHDLLRLAKQLHVTFEATQFRWWKIADMWQELERQVDASKLPCLLNLAACKCQQEPDMQRGESWTDVVKSQSHILEICRRVQKQCLSLQNLVAVIHWKRLPRKTGRRFWHSAGKRLR